MVFEFIFPLLLLSWSASAQTVGLDAIHNATSLVGTWSSGSRGVITGPGFANPANQTFLYPNTTGISYSFTGDGFYEIARYRFNGNGSQPTCITGVMNWVHGQYELLSNGSMAMTPFGDGFQQIQDPCAAQSNFVETYNLTELYVQWRIFQDPIDGFKLHLFQFDGSPLAPQFQVSTQPNMLPTQLLRNVTAQLNTQDGSQPPQGTIIQRSLTARNDAGRQWSSNLVGISVLATSLLGASVGLLL